MITSLLLRSRARLLLLALFVTLASAAGAQMPDLSRMSGTPLPVPDLPPGTVTVRVVRESLANNVPNQPVELQAGTDVRKGATDAGGRVQFDGVPPGAQVQARATVNGELLTSQTFPMPAQGGVRLILVAEVTRPGEKPAEAPAPSAPQGTSTTGLTLDAQSRIIVELADEALEVYYILELASGGTPAAESFVIDLPAGARSVTMLEGNSPQATAAGTRVTVAGPIQSGRTPVNLAFQLPYEGGSASFTQAFPVELRRATVLVRRHAGLQFTSPDAGDRSPVTMGDREYDLFVGPTVAAGHRMSFAVSGLPHHPAWPRYLALGLAAAILMAGVVLVVRTPSRQTSELQQLEAERDDSLNRIAAIDVRRGAGRSGHAAVREEYVSRLEHVLADLELHEQVAPSGTGAGDAVPSSLVSRPS